MAALFFNFRNTDLSSAIDSVAELKIAVRNSLLQSGFTDVVNTESEVAGNRNGVRVAVLHLHIGDTRFWQLVMGGGDAGDVTQRTVNEVMDKLTKLKFL